MKTALTVVIIIIFIYFLTAEKFSHINTLRLYNRVPWATYSVLDGKFMNYTFREPVRRMDVNFHTPSYLELWGYVGSGIPEAEDNGNLYANPNWELLFFNKGTYVNTIWFRRIYEAYHITLIF